MKQILLVQSIKLLHFVWHGKITPAIPQLIHHVGGASGSFGSQLTRLCIQTMSHHRVISVASSFYLSLALPVNYDGDLSRVFIAEFAVFFQPTPQLRFLLCYLHSFIPDVSIPGHIFQHMLEDHPTFPSQVCDIITSLVAGLPYFCIQPRGHP